ncbi:uncharacterized protein BT62DRAFT_1031428 [Guyanagaster necrorhizus]|uniref:Uncharacterized protein n=1 Tax=Guyanagaster necrorhizus TaxID=856835 RepID=A0A9P8AXM6_9AGAR|nr:uncharacterized protein BT62DRAFT_1031428 [Guyanagaster necrorhizus MCA 3950]KAG7451954.1 hypothetical protein BT62DRAFT_1031428 [Guyanagaster necrorhizus MCA 3950]
MNKSWSIGWQAMVIIIILLYVMTTFNISTNWLYLHSTFVNEQNFWTKSLSYIHATSGNLTVGTDTTGTLCTILTDTAMIWCCWVVWGQRWLTVVLPTLFLVCAIGESGGGLRAYHHVIEVLVESLALYSISLILYLASFTQNGMTLFYFDILAGITRGISPTLLVGHVVAGEAHPNESWQGSVMSGSLHFGTHSGSQSSQEDSITSDDLEAPQEIDDNYVHHTLVDSQKSGTIHEDDPEAQQFHTLRESQEDTGIGTTIPEKAQLEKPEDSHHGDEKVICGDGLEAQGKELTGSKEYVPGDGSKAKWKRDDKEEECLYTC